MPINVSPERALVFRITHRNNLAWICREGLHCANSDVRDPRFEPIGHTELIAKRANWVLPAPHRGTLSDYVPFYFTPASPMAYNIKTGAGVRKRGNDEIVTLVTSLHKLQEAGVPFVFTDRHALLAATRFSTDIRDLAQLPWPQFQARDFRRDPNDPEKMERYQAEALAWQHVPTSALLGVACVSDLVAADLNAIVAQTGVPLKVAARPQWYF